MKQYSKRKGFLALCLALLLSLSLFGCGSDGKYPPVKSEAPDSTVLAKWGDVEIKYELLRFFFLNRVSDFDGGDRGRWYAEEGDALWEEAAEAVLYQICDLYAAFEVARGYGIDPNNEEFDEKVDSFITADVEGGWVNGEWIEGYGSHEEYLAAIEREYHATDAVMRLVYRNTVILNALYDYVTNNYASGEITVTDEMLNQLARSEDCVHYNQVFISAEGRGMEWARTRAESIRNDMLAAGSYEELIRVGFAKSSDIPTQDTLKYGLWASAYTIDRALSPIYYDTLFSLHEGEVSPVIETEDGCYIFYGMEKPWDISSEEAYRADLIPLYLTHMYYLRIHEVATAMQQALTFTEEYARVRGATFLDDKRDS